MDIRKFFGKPAGGSATPAKPAGAASSSPAAAGGDGKGSSSSSSSKTISDKPTSAKSRNKKRQPVEKAKREVEEEEEEVVKPTPSKKRAMEGPAGSAARGKGKERKEEKQEKEEMEKVSAHSSSAKKKRVKRKVEESDDDNEEDKEEKEEEERDDDASWMQDTEESEEEDESEDDDDFGSSRKKKGGKKGGLKRGNASKKAPKRKKKQKVVEVREEEEEEGGRDGPKRTTRANPPSKPSPSTGTRQAMSAQDFFSGSTTSKYFSGEALATEASPNPAKGKEEGGKEGGAKKGVEVVELEDEVEETKRPMHNITSPSAAAAAVAPTPPPAKVKKEKGKPTGPPSSSSPGAVAASFSPSSSTAASKRKAAKKVEEEEEEEEEGNAGSRVSTPKPGTPAAVASSTRSSSSSSSSKSPKAVPHWQRRGGGGGRQGALKPSSRELPLGKPGCLEGMTFVVTGVTEAFGREEVEDLVKQYGGRITTSVSKKTTYLLTGSVLEDGREVSEGRKYKTAQENNNTKIISEHALYDMIEKSGPPLSSSSTPTPPPLLKPSPPKYVPGRPSGGPSSVASSSSSSSSSSGAAASSSSLPPPPSSTSSSNSDMWTSKYAPQTMDDLIGATGLASKLGNWLQQWDAIHRHKTKKVAFTNGKENAGARAALLSGPPGIGKSTTVALVARLQGFTVYELNASDTRNKKSLQEELGDVLDNTALASSGSLAAKTSNSKRLVVMDEVDGMSGQDRGGMQELIRLIKLSKVPIICICNDRGSTKVRSLANYCYDLRFPRPNKGTIAARMVDIAHREGLEADKNAIEHIVESVGNDVRQVLNTLQMWAKSSSRMTYMDAKTRLHAIDKDKNLRLSAFDAAKAILCETDRLSFLDRFNMFFIDYSLLPLLVEQNYIDVIRSRKGDTLQDKITRMDAAAAAVSDQDLVGNMIMGGDQHWELLPLQAALNVKVGYHAGPSFIPFPAFPQWLGKYSSTNKRRRLLGELAMHMSGRRISTSSSSLRLEYLPALKTRLVHLLREEGNVERAIEFLDAYGMSREDLMETMVELCFTPAGQKEPLQALDSKVKSALTRAYNSSVHKGQGLGHTAIKGAKKGGGAGLATGVAVDEDGTPLESEAGGAVKEEEEEAREEGEKEEEVDVSAFVKKGKRGGGGAKGGVEGGAGGKGKGKGKAKK